MGVNSSKLDVLIKIVWELAEFFNAKPGHDKDFNNALHVYIEMLNKCKIKQQVLHQERENQMCAKVRNKTEEGQPAQSQVTDFLKEEDTGGDREERREEKSLNKKEDQMIKEMMMIGQNLWNVSGSTSPSSHGSLFERLVMCSSIPSYNSPLNSTKTTLSTSRQHDKASLILLSAQNFPKSNDLLFS